MANGVLDDRAVGALVGRAVGDALGAPFEFGPPGAFSRRFPTSVTAPATEMVGGGPLDWAPGEFTDDTQMAVILGESLLDRNGLDSAHLFSRFQAWARTAPDVGAQTLAVLEDGDWRHSAARHFEWTGRAAGNGSLMRATASALFAADGGLDASIAIARAQSDLTHGDPAAGWGAARYHGLIHGALLGAPITDTLPVLLDRLPPPHGARYRALLTADAPVPDGPENGTVWTCLAQAVRVVRLAASFEDAVRQACDVGGDVDTVACVTGRLAGASFGAAAIPTRWTDMVHGTVERRVYRHGDLVTLAARLALGPRRA